MRDRDCRACAAPNARADLIAATQQVVPVIGSTGEPIGLSLNIALIDTATGTHFPLPAGVNTTADEFHPSLSADGHLLVFERRTPVKDGTRIIMVNLTTGQQADLFAPSEITADGLNDPTVSPDGSHVVVGELRTRFGPCPPLPPTGVIVIDVRSFPTGPFPVFESSNAKGFCGNGQALLNISSEASITNGGVIAWQYGIAGDTAVGAPFDVSLMPSGIAFRPGSANSATQPSIKPDNTSFIVFTYEPACGCTNPSDLWVATLGASGSVAFSILPTTTVNTTNDESRAAFTSDGRYLTFIRHRLSDGHDLLVVWDTVTQSAISSTDLGPVNPGIAPGTTDRNDGSTSPYLQPTLTFVRCCQTIDFTSLTVTGAGLLVQRIVGHHNLFGRTVPRLKSVGRFPLGKFAKGRHRTHWDFTVDGHRLSPGQYYVTLRAITSKLGVRDLSRPFLAVIRRGKPPIVRRVR